jgi:pimeloyl-ACP methyl ester carboxylesterase
MSVSRITIRLVALFLFLAGVLLLLRKPLFSQTITAAPTRFSVVIQGVAPDKGPDVILIPGLASSRDVYAAEAPLLTANYRLHLIQIAGFAGEPAGPNASGPILAPVVEQLHQYIVTNKLQHPAVIGHSLGGLLALMLAQSHPDDVSKILIIDSLPFYGLVFSPGATVENVAPQAKAMGDQLLKIPADQFAASQPLFATRLVTAPDGIKAVAASSIASDRTVFVNAMLEDLATDLRPQLAAIKTPTTVLYPYEAAEGPEPQVTALYTTAYAAMPNAHLIRIDNSRHFIMYDQPTAFDKAVQSFLKPWLQ